jgi:hypothetical protein
MMAKGKLGWKIQAQRCERRELLDARLQQLSKHTTRALRCDHVGDRLCLRSNGVGRTSPLPENLGNVLAKYGADHCESAVNGTSQAPHARSRAKTNDPKDHYILDQALADVVLMQMA